LVDAAVKGEAGAVEELADCGGCGVVGKGEVLEGLMAVVMVFDHLALACGKGI
jgi:hypothetical protein